MKAQILEKNGFPKPMGMLLIFLLICITCFANLMFANQPGSQTLNENQSAFWKKEIVTRLQQFDPLKEYIIRY